MGRLYAMSVSGGGVGSYPYPPETCASGDCPPCSPGSRSGGSIGGSAGGGGFAGGTIGYAVSNRGPQGPVSGGGPQGPTSGGGRNPCCSAIASRFPVRYFTGEVQLSVDDLVMEGFGRRWGHTRVFSNQLSMDDDLGNGYNWLVPQWAYIADLHGDQSELAVVISPSRTFWFDDSGSGFDARHGARQTLAENTTNGTYEFTDTDGTVWEFHDFSGTNLGKLAKDRSRNYCRMLRDSSVVPFGEQIVEPDL